jgi:hypothetical protein
VTLLNLDRPEDPTMLSRFTTTSGRSALNPGSLLSMAVVVIALLLLSAAAVQAADAETLPDKRVYEMVTPADNQDADVYMPEVFDRFFNEGVDTRLPFQVAENGDAVTYVGSATSAGFGAAGSGLGNQYLARRLPGGGWSQSVIAPPARKRNNYQGFSSDLSVGVLTSGIYGEPNVPPIAAGATGEGYSLLYECRESVSACSAPTAADPQPANPYQPIFGKPLYRTAKEFGTHDILASGKLGTVPVFAGGSSGFGVLAFEADDALIGGSGELEQELATDVKSEIKAGEQNSYLYQVNDGQLGLVDVLPKGEVAPDATFGAPPLAGPEDNAPDFDGVVSSDGQRLFWTDLRTGIVYVRVGGVVTVQVSAGAARYWASGGDGRYAFYEEDGGLYRFDDVKGEWETLAGAGGGVLGVLGNGEDGETAYFIAEGILAGANAGGQEPVEGQPNLYLWRHGSGPVFIATLSMKDGEVADPYGPAALSEAGAGGNFLHIGDWQPALGQRTAAVTGSGNSMVFVSNQRLPVVGYPNGYRNGGLDEVYLYEAAVNRLFCVSCSASTEVPSGSLFGAAAFLPISWSDTAQPEWISSDGDRVFFDSAAPLVSQDTNGKVDVYEWEREGTGSCEPGDGENGGCVYLLSRGTSEAGSWLVGASANGSDVFMVTRAQLVAADGNDADDLYDARVEGVEPVAPPACTGTGCQGVPAPPPPFATPASVTFEGPGNFAPAPPAPTTKVVSKAVKCPKGLVHKDAKCVRKHKPKTKSKAHTKRLARRR